MPEIKRKAYSLSLDTDQVTLSWPNLHVDLITCPLPRAFLPQLAGGEHAWLLEGLSAQPRGETERITSDWQDSKQRARARVVWNCRPDRIEVSASLSAAQDLRLASWDVFGAGARVQMWYLVNFRNIHGLEAVWPQQYLLRGGQPDADLSGWPEEMIERATCPVRATTFSTDWQFAPHPTMFIFQRDELNLFVGCRDLPAAFGMEIEVGGQRVNHWRLDYGGEEHGLSVAANETVVSPTFYLWFDENCAVYDTVDRYTARLVADGAIPAPRRESAPGWWRLPLYCTWGDQGARYRRQRQAEGSLSAYELINERLVLEALEIIRRYDLPIGSVILDDGWSIRGDGRAHPERFPDLRGLVDRLHQEGRRVLVWIGYLEFPAESEARQHPEWLMNGGEIFPAGMPAVDYSHPRVQAEYVQPLLRRLFSDEPGCYNLDGIKTDYLATKVWPQMHPYDPTWRGEERFLLNIQRLFYEGLKRYKPDGMLMGSCAHPHFSPYQDVVRTYDVGFDQLGVHHTRAEMIAHCSPGVIASYDLTFTYDAANQLTTRTYPDASTVTFTYSNVGLRTGMTDASGTTAYTYTNANQPSTVTFPNSKVVTYTYDNAGNRATMVDPDSGTTTYTYHDNNRLETLTNPNSEVTTWAYTNIGRVDTLSLNSGSVTTYVYDAAGQATGITHKKANDTIIEQLAYTYDDAGNRQTVTENSGDVTTWTYDNANQLTVEQRSGASAYTTTYTYDNVGNRATMVDSSGTTTYTYNAGNRLTLITDPDSTVTTNTYDNNGNLTVTNDNGTVTTNVWTYDNRLRTVTLATPATTTFTYDGDGLRRQTVTAAGTTNFIWDGQDVLLETDVSNNTQVTYTQTPDIYGNLVSQRRSTTTSFYHHDALGSTLALTDANENVTDTYKYFAFGNSLTSSGSTTNPFQYVGNLGYYNESALSLQYLRARYYQPGTGRFVSVDPAPGHPLDPVSLHQYLYAANNPVNYIDPAGLTSCWVKCLPWALIPIAYAICVYRCEHPEVELPPEYYPSLPDLSGVRKFCGRVTKEYYKNNPSLIGDKDFHCADCCTELASTWPGIGAALVDIIGPITTFTPSKAFMDCQDACEKNCSGRAGVTAYVKSIGVGLAANAVLEILLPIVF